MQYFARLTFDLEITIEGEGIGKYFHVETGSHPPSLW